MKAKEVLEKVSKGKVPFLNLNVLKEDYYAKA